MESDRPALVLLHGVTMSGSAWQEVVPLLSSHYDVHTPTVAGHTAADLRPSPARDHREPRCHEQNEGGAGQQPGGGSGVDLRQGRLLRRFGTRMSACPTCRGGRSHLR